MTEEKKQKVQQNEEAAQSEEDIEKKDSSGEEGSSSSSEMKWYIVHTYSGYEHRARLALLERIRLFGKEAYFGEILVPEENVVDLVKGQKKVTKRRFFPGYILVQMILNDETWHIVRHTPRITGFVSGNKIRPQPISEEEVKKLTHRIVEGKEKPKPKVSFKEGESVRVIDGPFSNFSGTVEEVNFDKGKVKILVSIFGRATPVELDFAQVEKI